MNTRQEITEIIQQLPEEVLQELLQYLQQLETKTSQQIRLSLNLQTILKEDKELLERLAK